MPTGTSGPGWHGPAPNPLRLTRLRSQVHGVWQGLKDLSHASGRQCGSPRVYPALPQTQPLLEKSLPLLDRILSLK